MNFVVFPVSSTNIFPLANSTAGGQLLTEFNLRSRESVATDPTVKYMIGPSYTHSVDDFAIQAQQDTSGVTISNTVLQITPGKALVNGHYIESLAPLNIDITEANYLASKEGIDVLKGELAVGFRMVYSNYETLAGSALVENKDDYYEGIQVVIVPKADVKLPADVPNETEFTQVNMHLLLGTFTFRNGKISSVNVNANKVQSISADRISNINGIIKSSYISKEGLDPDKLYVYSTKTPDGVTYDDRDTWCEANDSLMIWDKDCYKTSDVSSISSEARFQYIENADATDGTTYLRIPHKQIDGMTTVSGRTEYYRDKYIALPEADFVEGKKGGVVGPKFVNRLLSTESKIDTFYRLPNGRMRQYIPVLSDRANLPDIPTSIDERWPYSKSEYVLDISTIQAAIADLQKRVSDLENSLNSLSISTGLGASISQTIDSSIKASLSDINAGIVIIQSNISDLSTRVSRLENKIDDDDTSTLSSRINVLQNQLVSLASKVEELSAAVQDIEATIDSEISEATTELSATIQADLQAAVTSIEGLIEDIKTELKTYIDAKVADIEDTYTILPVSQWRPGDYVLVGEDLTVGSVIDGRGPSTMYVVIPGYISDIAEASGSPLDPISIDLSDQSAYQEAYAQMIKTVPPKLAGGVELSSVEITSPDVVINKDLWNYTAFRGMPGIDYFVARVKTTDTTLNVETWTNYFYTPTLLATRFSYADPIMITGGVPLATQNSVGGFYNVSDTAYGNGYVRLNEDGYLQLMDYQLLATGFLAYQLGQDRAEGAGLSVEEIQNSLVNYVNGRILFPNDTQILSAAVTGADPNVINLTLTLPSEVGTNAELIIRDISAWYGTNLYVHIVGNAPSDLTIRFINCERLRIDSNYSGNPTIILEDVNLYYDAEILDKASQISGLSLWYKRDSATSPNLQVEDMKVTLLDSYESNTSYDPWTTTYANDNHYSYALRSLTFASDGSVCGIGVSVSDDITANIQTGKSIFTTGFELPQSSGLNYPISSFTSSIKVVGSFVSGYWPSIGAEDGYLLKHTDFSILLYPASSGDSNVRGEVAFYTDAEYISDVTGVDSSTVIHSWNSANCFEGYKIDYVV